MENIISIDYSQVKQAIDSLLPHKIKLIYNTIVKKIHILNSLKLSGNANWKVIFNHFKYDNLIEQEHKYREGLQQIASLVMSRKKVTDEVLKINTRLDMAFDCEYICELSLLSDENEPIEPELIPLGINGTEYIPFDSPISFSVKLIMLDDTDLRILTIDKINSLFQKGIIDSNNIIMLNDRNGSLTTIRYYIDSVCPRSIPKIINAPSHLKIVTSVIKGQAIPIDYHCYPMILCQWLNKSYPDTPKITSDEYKNIPYDTKYKYTEITKNGFIVEYLFNCLMEQSKMITPEMKNSFYDLAMRTSR